MWSKVVADRVTVTVGVREKILSVDDAAVRHHTSKTKAL